MTIRPFKTGACRDQASLLPPPPWYYSGDLLTVEYRTEPGRVAALLPEPLRPAAQDPDAVALEHVDQRICEEPVADAIALAEVARELEAVHAHSRPPSSRPSHTASTPLARLSTRFSASARSSPSSPRRCDSNIHVENVV